MKIRNSFTIARPIAESWAILNDVPRVARCAPGAELLEERGDGRYVGTVAIKLGPVALKFKGTFTYKEKDETAHRVVAEANGNEEKARGSAHAILVFLLAANGATTRVDIESDLQLAGPIAQYGRGAAILQSTAQALIDQFAENLAAELRASPMPAAGALAPSSAPISLPRVIASTLGRWLREWLGGRRKGGF